MVRADLGGPQRLTRIVQYTDQEGNRGQQRDSLETEGMTGFAAPGGRVALGGGRVMLGGYLGVGPGDPIIITLGPVVSLESGVCCSVRSEEACSLQSAVCGLQSALKAPRCAVATGAHEVARGTSCRQPRRRTQQGRPSGSFRAHGAWCRPSLHGRVGTSPPPPPQPIASGPGSSVPEMVAGRQEKGGRGAVER